jgi:hypothetical protein
VRWGHHWAELKPGQADRGKQTAQSAVFHHLGVAVSGHVSLLSQSHLEGANGSNDKMTYCLLTDILIVQLMCQSYPLWLVLHGFAIHNGCFELFHDSSVNSIALKHVPNAISSTLRAKWGWYM